jgi:hypothetical protein
MLKRLSGSYTQQAPVEQRQLMLELLRSEGLQDEGLASASKTKSEDRLMQEWDADFGKAGSSQQTL